MNYLAHAYLSFHHKEILAGNMISDFVKGKKQFVYPPAVQKGIRLHRQIDTFTDQHSATKEAATYLKPAVGAYAGAFIDVVYDHFLANDTDEFSEKSLADFAQGTYTALTDQLEILPERFAGMLPYMSSQNWLYGYRFTEGIEKSFGGIVRRAVYLNDPQPAFALFLQHYDALKNLYKEFFPSLKKFASSQFDVLLHQ